MLSRRSGISSIIGSIFLILIAFLVLSTSLFIFNSFNQYASTLKKSNQVDLQALETSIQIRKAIFGGTPQPVISQNFYSIKNTARLPFFPISNMNFTQSALGWFFTRSYFLFPPDSASVSNSPLNSIPGTIAFTMTVGNARSSENDIAQVSITVDSRFTVPSSQSSPRGWTPTVSGNTITWTANTAGGTFEPNDIDPGKQVTFSWTAIASNTGTYYHTVTIWWVANDSPPFIETGTGTLQTVIGSTSGSSSSTTITGNLVLGASGANGGYDPSTPIGSLSGPGSLYLFFQPQINGLPINQNQQLGAIMNFTTSFVLDSSTASSITGAALSYGYSLDSFVCNGDENECSVQTSIYLIQESTGNVYTLASFNPTTTGGKRTIPSGWVFVTGSPLSGILWTQGKYDLIVSTVAILRGSNPGSENYPVSLYMHFDDIGLAIKLTSTSYYVDTWSQSQAFIIQTGIPRINISAINLDVILGTNTGPVYAYIFLNDFSRGTISAPSWTLMNSTVFSQTADIQIVVPNQQVRLFVDAQGRIALRVYAISLSQFTLNVQVSTVVQALDQTRLVVQILNSSPFTVHLVSLYISGPSGLVHFDINGSALGVAGPFDVWLSPGQVSNIQVSINWVRGQTYIFTVVADNGVMAASSFKS